jgi:hypothetical protein
MNAYELAYLINNGGENIDRKELSMMLCQQADLIKEASQFIQEQGLEGQWIIWSQKANEK